MLCPHHQFCLFLTFQILDANKVCMPLRPSPWPSVPRKRIQTPKPNEDDSWDLILDLLGYFVFIDKYSCYFQILFYVLK